MAATPPEPLCTCGHAEADHYAGTAYCKLCGPDTCQHFTSTTAAQPPLDDEDGRQWMVVFTQGGDTHAALAKAVEVKQQRLESPPTTETEIIAYFTTFSRLKDPQPGLRGLIDALTSPRAKPHPINRHQLFETLQRLADEYLEHVYESARLSQGRVARDEWQPALKDLMKHIYRTLQLTPLGTPLSQDLNAVLQRLWDKSQWPTFTQLPARGRGNPLTGLTADFRAELLKLGIRNAEVQKDLLRYLGLVTGDPTPEVE